MTRIIAANITSPLGMTAQDSYRAVRSGKTALSVKTAFMGVPGRMCVAGFSPEQDNELSVSGLTRFQSLVYRSVSDALSRCDAEPGSPRTIFILSTTKADVACLAASKENDGEYLSPGESARKVARLLGFVNDPLVVCNACISGVTAQILADRLIRAGYYDTAVVCGADSLSPFTLAGFGSFKALSPKPCRPYDIERLGLNLGEGAATVVMREATKGWGILSGALDNDAYHVSAPSPSGEGIARVVAKAVDEAGSPDIATVTAHGTATMFNDQMESKAIESCGLSAIPVTAYKGCFGHTLGAAGLIESIVTMMSLDEGVIIPVKGYSECGVSGKINVTTRELETAGRAFLKMISGFGGCNGALVYSRSEAEDRLVRRASAETVHRVRITPSSLEKDGETIVVTEHGKSLVTEIYKRFLDDNPKFYKMDLFSRLALVAAGMLIKEDGASRYGEETALVLFNRTSSVLADRAHLQTFTGSEGFFPSPSVFLYTLPNVVMGEIAVRYGIKGETTLVILPGKDQAAMDRIVDSTLSQTGFSKVITGWVDCADEDGFEADMKMIFKK